MALEAAANTLRAEKLVKSFSGRRVVNEVSVKIEKGEIIGLLGPNGAGKSTTFYMIVGRIIPDSGNVWLGGQELSALPMYQRARAGIGYLPQEASVFRSLTVRQNLDLVLEESGVPADVRGDKISSLLDDYGLKHLQDTKGVSLSGGERRRVEIARCLALEPHFILLDEPFSGIDPIAVADLQSIIRDPQGTRLRHPAHRPQRARDALDNGPRVSHIRGQGLPRGRAGGDRRQRQGEGALPRKRFQLVTAARRYAFPSGGKHRLNGGSS